MALHKHSTSTKAIRTALATHRVGCQGNCNKALSSGDRPARLRGDKEGEEAVGMDGRARSKWEPQGWHPSTVTSRHTFPACESGVHTLMQTHPTLFQVSMADLCLVPQVANAER